MAGTTLSRKSFYVYFSDRYELLERLFQELRARLDEANRLFLENQDVLNAGRAAFAAVAEIAKKEGAPMRALFEASAHDPRAARLWRRFNDPVAAAFAAKIRAEIDAGRAEPMQEIDGIARVLVGMNLFALFDQVVNNPKANIQTILDNLFEVWTRTLTLRPVPSREGRQQATRRRSP